MANFVFNISLGRVVTYADLANAADAFIFVPLETAGLEADATLRDYNDLSTLLAGTSNEQVTLGRKNVTSATITVNDTTELVDVDIADQTWVASAGNAISAMLIVYDPDTGTGTDTTVIPITKHDFVATPDGTDITAVVNANGFFRATG